MPRRRKPDDPFRWFDSSPEVIRLVVMMYVRYPLSLRNVEDLLHERGVDICHETVRLWWTRFGPMFAAEIRRKRVDRMRQSTHWRWHLDEVYVRINGEMRYLWRAVDHEGEVLESFVTKERDKAAALKFIKKALKRHGSPKVITTDGLRSYGAAMRELGNSEKREVGRWANNPGGELPPAVPKTRTSHAPVQKDEDTPDLRLGPRLLPQPLQPGTPPHQPRDLQGQPLSRTGRVADPRDLASAGVRGAASQRRQVAVGLTAPFAHLKRILRLDRLRLRGPNGARDEFLLAATAQNLRRLAKLTAPPTPAMA